MFSKKTPFIGTSNYWYRWEKSLLILLIFGKFCALLKNWNIGSGFDWRAYVGTVGLPFMKIIDADLDSFYGYHPPTAFLLAKIPLLIGFTPLQGVQLLSFLASLATFFLLRAMLQHMQWLDKPAPIAFLYIASAIPLQVYMTTSASMDTVLLPLAAAILYLSLIVFVPKQDAHVTSVTRLEVGLYIVAIFAIALLTKFSGILLLCIPVLVGFFMSPKKDYPLRLKNVGFAILTAVIAITMVFPYYFQRYYQTSGSFFPSNNDYIGQLHQAPARVRRDEAGWKFFSDMLLTVQTFDIREHPEWRDMHKPRLVETWKDFWRRDIWLGKTSAPTRSVTIWYLIVMPWLVLGGVVLFFCRRLKHMRSRWWVFGLVLLIFSLTEIAALIKYTYDYPWGGGVLMKASYIAPTMWILAYFLSQYFSFPYVLFGEKPLTRRIQSLGLFFVGCFVLVNYLLPVY